ncbi:NB-ARC domain-containing protein [Tumidithrix elongata RA019]|uniref:NB-ARC domain-containing protein n=1 Tax=Tumidithrix elongata BACA0141 TaxID=2716417 RepID=A0AAW9PYR5_9CYAN|nr:NB-ARC domain-containing protein [Tumidithrix elongata RA019]
MRWTKRSTPAWWITADIAKITLGRFWDRDRIRRDNFIAICKAVGITDWQAIAESEEFDGELEVPTTPTNRTDWGEYPESNVIGRAQELTQLETWMVREKNKLVAILGMGGMGKTTLAVAIAEQIQGEFDYLIWRSLRNAPPIERILTDLISFLSNQQQNAIPDHPKDNISLLMECLKKNRCLIVLDNVDSIMSDRQAGQYLPNYEIYGELFRHIRDENHKSCLLITSREFPQELSRLTGNRVNSLRLRGLSTQEGREIFDSAGFKNSTDEELQPIIEHYAGNPLALNIVASGIRDLLVNDISQMRMLIQKGSLIFGDIQDLLQRHFDRLSKLEQEVMYWLAIVREPILLQELTTCLLSLESQQYLSNSLQSLIRRSLIEVTPSGYTQQPVVMEYTTHLLIEKICEEFKEMESGTILPTKLFNTHALIAATAKDFIRDAQVRLLLLPIADKVGKQAIAALLPKLRASLALQSGYAGGNLLNLFVQLGIDLTGWDFSQLAIWQAHLRGANLHQVNFSHADFSQSVLGETFVNVNAIAFSPDGQQLASGESRGQIHLWQVGSGKNLLEIDGHTDIIFAIAFSPDRNYLASGSLDQSVKLWNVKTGACEKILLESTGGISMLAFSPDGKTLACSCGDRTIRVVNFITGECTRVLEGHTNIPRAIAFHPKEPFLASCGLDRTIRIWDLERGKEIQAIEQEHEVYTVAFNPAGTLLASAGEDGKITILKRKDNTKKNTQVWEFAHCLEGHTNRLWSLAFSPDGHSLASAGDDFTIRIWDVEDRECLRNWIGHQSRIWAVAFSPDGNILASGSEDKSIKFWNPENGYCLQNIQGHSNAIAPFGFRAQQVYTLNYDEQTIGVWDIHTGNCDRTFSTHAMNSLQTALSPDGSLVVSASLEHTAEIVDVKSGTSVATLKGHTTWIREAIFSPDGTWIATASGDKTAKIWEIGTGKCIHTLAGHSMPLQAIAFSPDSKILATGAWDAAIGLWDVDSGACLGMLQGHRDRIASLSFHPDGQMLASGSRDATIRLWDIADIYKGKCLRTFSHRAVKLHAVAFHPNGKMLASSGLDTEVRLWHVETGELLRSFKSNSQVDWIWSIVFNEDGRFLVSGSEDGSCQIWDVATGNCLQTLRIPRPYEGTNIKGIRGLTESQKSTFKQLGAVEL